MLQGEQNTERKFANIEETCGFWKALWEEKEENGNVDADWIKEIRSALTDVVPEPPREASELDACGSGRIIGRRRNWSAPDPGGSTNFRWKKARVHEDVAMSFPGTAHQPEFPM